MKAGKVEKKNRCNAGIYKDERRMSNPIDRLVSCGKCEKQWGNDDFVEMQECLNKRDIGGYGSVFGDGQAWEITLCQNCALELLEPYIVWQDS